MLNKRRSQTWSFKQCFIVVLALVMALVLCGLIAYGVVFVRHRKTAFLNLRRSRRAKHGNEPKSHVNDIDEDPSALEELVWVPELGWTTKRKSAPVNLAEAALPEVAIDSTQAQSTKEAIKVEESVSSLTETNNLGWGPLLQLASSNLFDEKEPSSQQRNALDLALRFRESSRKYLTRDSTEIIRARVTGQKNIIKRDLPLIAQGYESAFAGPHQWMFKQQISESDVMRDRFMYDGMDLVLCLSLSTCSRKDDVYLAAFEANPGMRINRVPNLRGVLWSKQNLCKNIPPWLAELISFPCWVLPEQEQILLDTAIHRPSDFKWIAKPWAGGGGNGISLVSGYDELRELLRPGKNLVVQPFLMNPLLVNNRKIDLRVYVLLTSTSPLRAYIHERGLVRFASSEYKEASLGSQRGQFLTNTSVNKKESNATAAELTWPFSQLYQVLGSSRSRVTRLGIDRAISSLLLAAEPHFPQRTGCETDGACYHLLGFDVILSASEKESPRIIEVNGEPSFALAAVSNSDADSNFVEHYHATKISVARDISRIVFGPISSSAKANAHKLLAQVDNTKFAQYILELCREQSITDVEFRQVYPSAISALFPRQDELIFARILERDIDRLRLHEVLNIWERMRLIQCHENATICAGPLRSTLDDLLGEGLAFPSTQDQRENGSSSVGENENASVDPIQSADPS